MDLKETSVGFTQGGQYRCTSVFGLGENNREANLTVGKIYIAERRLYDQDSAWGTSYLEIKDNDGRRILFKESCLEYVY